MALTWFAGVLLSDTGYQPRHRSTRRTGNGVDRLDCTEEDVRPDAEGAPAEADRFTGPLDLVEDQESQDFLDQLTFGEIRRILEGCALDDPTKVVPELVQLIAHSAHTPATLTRAWSEFEEATRDVYAMHLRNRDWSALFRRDEASSDPDEDATALMLSYADDAWRLITRGPKGVSARGAGRRATSAGIR
jgi:hypothetical protein